MNTMPKLEPMPPHVTVLIAEDDDGHADLIMELLLEVGIKNPLIRFRDGQEVLDFLGGSNQPTHLVDGRHYLLLLDIRMPRVGGLEVLRQMKSNLAWRDIPVIMLTTTDDPREIQSCYQAGCNCYITKPVEFGRFAAVLRQLGLFMLIIQLPRMNAAQDAGVAPQND
jgi:CheY-like chemotaxis protein